MLVGFIIGLFVGSTFGMLISAVLVASSAVLVASHDNEVHEDY